MEMHPQNRIMEIGTCATAGHVVKYSLVFILTKMLDSRKPRQRCFVVVYSIVMCEQATKGE